MEERTPLDNFSVQVSQEMIGPLRHLLYSHRALYVGSGTTPPVVNGAQRVSRLPSCLRIFTAGPVFFKVADFHLPEILFFLLSYLPLWNERHIFTPPAVVSSTSLI